MVFRYILLKQSHQLCFSLKYSISYSSHPCILIIHLTSADSHYMHSYFFCQVYFSLLFTHKLDTCCQAMCQECKTAKNPAFRQRRTLNRLDSVTVCTIGVNCNYFSPHFLSLVTVSSSSSRYRSKIPAASRISWIHGLFL